MSVTRSQLVGGPCYAAFNTHNVQFTGDAAVEMPAVWDDVETAAQTVTLTDQQPGGGSTIYYTTDGSFPGSGNLAAVVYTTPFTVASGTVVRTAAYNGALQGSMIDTFVVN